MLLSSGLELTNSVASFVVAVISVCVLNSKGKFDLNQPWSHIIKANEQVPICIKVNNSIIQKKSLPMSHFAFVQPGMRLQI